MSPKYPEGTTVEIKGYGSLMYVSKEEYKLGVSSTWKILGVGAFNWVMDSRPDLVGQTGVVRKAELTQGQWKYALDGPDKTAWYNEEQLKQIKNERYGPKIT